MAESGSMIYQLPQLVLRAAEADAAQAALRYRGESLTYGDLARRSAQMAHALIADGARPGDRVGILLNKGFDSAVALYGIMAAGCVYVPLDPGAPSARIEFVVRDCGIERLVSDVAHRATLDHLHEADAGIHTVFGPSVDDGLHQATVSWRVIGAADETAPSVSTMEDDLCYILYTSGSTGTPKGIMHTHASALAWARLSASVYRLGPTDVISNYAPLHFDLSTLDYFGGAQAGATTVIIPEEYTKFPASLAGLIADERLTVFYTVPLALVQLAAPGLLDAHDLSALRLVLFGGEPMPIKHLRAVMQSLPGAEFVNVYGPTETNGCTHHPVLQIPEEDDPALPIGRPYPNVDVLVVDADDVPVAVGESGELLVRAPTMMRGYWGRHDLNLGAFFSRNEHGGVAEVFHRTGDLVEATDGGELRFLGRRDRQIKARGNRVELDEVESVVLGHPSVHEAAVYALPDREGSLQIHAEVILVEENVSDTTDISRHCRDSLPTYAVPVTIHVRRSFPRTSTGKIDRRAMQVDASAGAEA